MEGQASGQQCSHLPACPRTCRLGPPSGSGWRSGRGPDTNLTGVGSLDPLSGQRLCLGGARVPVLGQALPCIEGRHAGCPSGAHACGAHARRAHQPSHAGRVHAAGDAGPPRASVLQELAVKRLCGPHLGRKERGPRGPPFSTSLLPTHAPSASRSLSMAGRLPEQCPWPHRSVLAQLLALLLLQSGHGGRGSGCGGGSGSSHGSSSRRLSEVRGGSCGV